MTQRPVGPARPVRVVLDSSAIVAFTRSSIHVGETLAEINDEDAAAGLPVLCLAHALQAVADTDRLEVLIAHDTTVLLDNRAETWQALAALYDTVGPFDAASAVLAAIDLDAVVLSGQPGLYAGLQDGGPVIALPPD